MIEICIICDEPTGRAGQWEDSLYDSNGVGPYCEGCYQCVVGEENDDHN